MKRKIRRIKGTLLLKDDYESVRVAARIIEKGGLVAFPTETVYGLGADATNPKAVEKIFHAKGRPSDNPLIVHLSDPEQVKLVSGTISEAAACLVNYFWPGPLSLVLPRSDIIPPIVSAGLSTVAVRMPAHPAAIKLLKLSGKPIAAPSANRSGSPSPHFLSRRSRRSCRQYRCSYSQ
jgi:L-threonylcarbamoyladenylate synthase